MFTAGVLVLSFYSWQLRAKEEYEAKLAHLDGRHEYLITVLAEKLSLPDSAVQDALLDGDQVE